MLHMFKKSEESMMRKTTNPSIPEIHQKPKQKKCESNHTQAQNNQIAKNQ